MQLITIAGGLGTRSQSKLPKSLVEIEGKSLWKHQFENNKLENKNINHLFLLGHEHESIVRDIKNDAISRSTDISFFVEKERLGTGGALFQARDFIEEECAVFLGDIFMKFDLSYFLEHSSRQHHEASIVAHPNGHSYDSDSLEIDPMTKSIKRILKKNNKNNELLNSVLSVAGIYYFRNLKSKLFEFESLFDGKTVDIIDVLELLIGSNNSVSCYITSEFVKDAGTPSRRQEIARKLSSGAANRRSRLSDSGAIILDRDDTLVADLSKFQLQLAKGVANSISKANELGVRVYVASNQPRAAKGFGIDLIHRENKLIDTKLEDAEAFIDEWYWCPHHPDGGYSEEFRYLKVICRCRKPDNGLLKFIESDHGVNLSKSIFIGNSVVDLDAANSAGVNFFHTREFGSCKIEYSHKCFDRTSDAVNIAIGLLC